MNAWLPAWPQLAAFLAASVVLAVSPGPGVFYIVARALAHGRRAGLASVAGVALGNLGNALGAALGLAALFAVSSAAFTLVKYAGAAYLIYLGAKTLRARAAAAATASPAPARAGVVFRDGLYVALLNPKTAVFFAAFLPQFIEAGASSLQSLLLGAIFVAIAAVTDTAYALLAGAAAPALAQAHGVRAVGRYTSAGVLIGLGVYAAVAGPRGAVR